MKDIMAMIHQAEEGTTQRVQVTVTATSPHELCAAMKQAREMFPDHLLECVDFPTDPPWKGEIVSIVMVPSVDWF